MTVLQIIGGYMLTFLAILPSIILVVMLWLYREELNRKLATADIPIDEYLSYMQDGW